MAQNNGDGNTNRPAMGAPGSGAPGSGGASGGGRMFQWKGKATSIPTTAAGADESPVGNGINEGDAVEMMPERAMAGAIPGAVPEPLERRMDQMFSEMGEVHSLLLRLSERDTHNEKAFNTLHAELSDYKKDFIYEHLKPVVRPLLFLFDSIEGFETEVTSHEIYSAPAGSPGVPSPSGAASTGEAVIPTRIVRQNAAFFREQLVEALRICEVTPMDTPEGRPDGKMHKVMRVVPVEPAQDGLIQGVIRSGWFLNGHLLRAAEVIVGKHRG